LESDALDLGKLITPCRCWDSADLSNQCGNRVHQRCLDIWRATGWNPSNFTRCEVCKTPYTSTSPVPAHKIHTWLWLVNVLLVILVALAAVIVAMLLQRSTLAKDGFLARKNYSPSLARLGITLYILGILGGLIVMVRLYICPHSQVDKVIRHNMKHSLGRRRTWMSVARTRRERSFDCCPHCSLTDRLLFHWAVSNHFGGGQPSMIENEDCCCCPCDDCAFSVEVGTSCECCPCDLDSCMSGSSHDETGTLIQCGIIVFVLMFLVCGGAVLFYWVAWSHISYGVRMRVARHHVVVDMAPAQATVIPPQLQEEGPPKPQVMGTTW